MKDELALASELGIDLSVLRQVAMAARACYRYQRRKKGEKVRTLREPTGKLRQIQDAIKTKILNRLWLPDTMHGWRKGRSPKTYVRPHIRRSLLLNADIQDFFPTVTAGRVCAFWETAGYSPSAARLLTALTTCDNQLPQGSPTSAAIGNQILRGVDRRLSGVARKHDLGYSNLADEVALSGGKRTAKVKNLVSRIVQQEGFKLNPDKVKLRRHHERQELAGIVVNRKLSIGRQKYRALRAIVHNCVKYGPQQQNKERHPNFRAHLQGRIAQFRSLNAHLGDRLWQEFTNINWDEAA